MNKDPNSYSLLTYLWVATLSIWGGVAHYIRKIKANKRKAFSIAELLGDIIISGFIGILTFFLAQSANIDNLMTAFLIGISSHMGARGLAILEEIAEKKINKVLGLEEDDKK